MIYWLGALLRKGTSHGVGRKRGGVSILVGVNDREARFLPPML